jgi:hypothetical protein
MHLSYGLAIRQLYLEYQFVPRAQRGGCDVLVDGDDRGDALRHRRG